MVDNQTNFAILALFLRVLAGRSGNTGCQAAAEVASMGLFLGLTMCSCADDASLFLRPRFVAQLARRGGACLKQAGKGPVGANLGFLYITDNFAGEVADILAYFRTNTGILHWTGTVGMGVVGTGREYYDEPALAIMLCAFEDASFRVFSGVRTPQDLERQPLHFGGLPANFAIVHGDPRNAQLARLIGDFAGVMESGFIAGGLTSSRREVTQIADGIAKGGLSGVLFSDEVVVSTRLTQGCSPIGPRHTITGSRQNVLISLDGRAALDVFSEDVGLPLSRNLAQLGGTIFAGLHVGGSDADDYVVRNLVGIDPVHKLLAIGDVPQTGGEIIFCRRDETSATEDMADARQHHKWNVRAAAGRPVLLLCRPRPESFRRRVRGSRHDPAGSGRFSAGRILLQRRDFPQQVVWIHWGSYVVPLKGRERGDGLGSRKSEKAKSTILVEIICGTLNSTMRPSSLTP